MQASRWSGWARLIAWNAIVAILFYATGWFGLHYVRTPAGVAVLWPPSGFALAAVYLLGPRVTPGIALGAIPLLLPGVRPWAAVIVLAGECVSAMLGAWSVRKLGPRDEGGRPAPLLERVRGALVFLGYGALAPALVNGLIGCTAYRFGGAISAEEYGDALTTWLVGDVMGALLVAAPIIAWSQRRHRTGTAARALEGAAVVAAQVLTAGLVFLPFVLSRGPQEPLAFLCLPPLAYGALRFGSLGATGLSLLLSGFAVVGAVQYGWPNSTADVLWRVYVVWAFTVSSCGVALLLGATADENRASILEADREGSLRQGFAAVLEHVASGAPLASVLERLVLVAQAHAQGMIGSVLLLQDGKLRDGAGPGLPEEYRRLADGIPIGEKAGSCGTAAYLGRRVIVSDIQNDPLWEGHTELAARFGFGACWSTPILGGGGRVLGTFAMYYRAPRSPTEDELHVVDVAAHIARIAIERAESEARTRDEEERMRTLVEGLQVGVVVFAPDLSIVLANPAARDLLGLSARAVRRGSVLGPLQDVVHEDGSAFTGYEQPAPIAARTGRTVENVVMGVRRAGLLGAERIWLLVNAHPDTGPGGEVRRVIVTYTDITERRAIERRQSLMMEELDHRVKNNLASILALAETSSRTVSSLPEFRQSFTGRVRALGHVHALLAQSRWSGVRIEELVRWVLEAYSDPARPRIVTGGPSCMLPARAAPPLCMALHELATNAVKYGALSSPAGRVTVEWSITGPTEQPDSLSLTWLERGGPEVKQPAGRGFGSSLIKGAIAHQLDGEVTLEFDPLGVRCAISVDFKRLREGESAINERRAGRGAKTGVG